MRIDSNVSLKIGDECFILEKKRGDYKPSSVKLDERAFPRLVEFVARAQQDIKNKKDEEDLPFSMVLLAEGDTVELRAVCQIYQGRVVYDIRKAWNAGADTHFQQKVKRNEATPVSAPKDERGFCMTTRGVNFSSAGINALARMLRMALGCTVDRYSGERKLLHIVEHFQATENGEERKKLMKDYFRTLHEEAPYADNAEVTASLLVHHLHQSRLLADDYFKFELSDNEMHLSIMSHPSLYYAFYLCKDLLA